MKINAPLYTSHHRTPGPFEDAGVAVDSLRGIHSAIINKVPLRCQQELHTQRPLGVLTGINPEDSIWRAWRPCSGSSSTYPLVMIAVIVDILHRTTKMCSIVSAITNKLNVSRHMLI
jgi:hypothetical protein